MAGFKVGGAEMEMEMEMEMDAGPSTPFRTASPVLRPIGVSPTIGISKPGDWYRGNRWPPAHNELAHGVGAAPDEVTVKWKEELTRRDAAEGTPLPDRQWTSHFYSIAMLGEFVDIDLHPAAEENKAFKEFLKDVKPINGQSLTWNSIDLCPELFLRAANAAKGGVTTELEELQQLMDYRPNVLSETLAQRNGIDNYFRGILSFTPSSHPWTFGLMQLALQVGEFQVMYYKYQFNRPRPSHVCPWLMPPIEVPGHASYPSGHATQAHLVALILGEVMPLRVMRPPKPLRLLADRIARNREVLGLHYPSDSRAGAKLAKESFLLLRKCNTVDAMIRGARQEWKRPKEDNLDATIENMRGL